MSNIGIDGDGPGQDGASAVQQVVPLKPKVTREQAIESMLDLFETSTSGMSPLFSYFQYIKHSVTEISTGMLWGGATALYMNAFEGLAEYIFMIAFAILFVWKFFMNVATTIFGYWIIGFMKRLGRNTEFGRFFVVTLFAGGAKFFAFFFAIFVFLKYFEKTKELSFDTSTIPLLRYMIAVFNGMETYVFSLPIMTGTVWGIVSQLVGGAIPLVIVSTLSFLWQRKS